MSDQRIQYDEEMVGAGHPTKPDTLNRLALAETGTDGKGKHRYLVEQTSAPTTGADELVLYAKDAGGELALFCRGENDGDEIKIA